MNRRRGREMTTRHIERVRELVDEARVTLAGRGFCHDASKLRTPEAEVFKQYGPKLHGMTYDSPEYKAALAKIKPAADHHYANNRHHPEHFKKGVQDMTLIDLLEMLADWKAAGERHADGSMAASLDKNGDRFMIPLPIMQLLRNTVDAMGWGDEMEVKESHGQEG